MVDTKRWLQNRVTVFPSLANKGCLIGIENKNNVNIISQILTFCKICDAKEGQNKLYICRD